MRKLIILIISFVIFISCSTLTLTPKTQNINSSGILQLPVVAELEVKNEKITGESSQMHASNNSLSIIKSNAVNNALSKSSGDVLIEPKYIIKTERGMTQVTVTGYPGIYKNFHTITEDDIPLIKSGDLHQLD
ncbi:MAG: hypothetical protein U9Q98_04535 [Bacteroidota bacterium]|nr:hypothetical protein [Bacteroidota bacterium]